MPCAPVVSTPADLNDVWKFHVFVLSGRLPLMKELRLGEQTACCTYVLLKTIAVFARAWRFGAWTPLFEKGSNHGRMSSQTTTSRFLALGSITRGGSIFPKGTDLTEIPIDNN